MVSKNPASQPIIVVGDGWAALGSVGFLVTEGREVLWIKGTGARLLPPLASLESGFGAEQWERLASRMGLEIGEPQTGSFLREFRNKAFREPLWTKAPTTEARREVRDECLWEPERQFVGPFEARFELPLEEIEEQIRRRLTEEGAFKNLRILEDVPLAGFTLEEGVVQDVVLGSGEKVSCERVIFADRWKSLGDMTGLPKPLGFNSRIEAMGALQVTFHHDVPMGVGIEESFFGALHREAGEENERRAWGWFSSDGKRSVWTICLSPDEVEDNHLIAKKLRRLKSALDKMFAGESWLPAGKAEFSATVQSEHVRFEEAALLGRGKAITEPALLKHASGIAFLTDAQGPSAAMALVGTLMGASPKAEAVEVEMTLEPVGAEEGAQSEKASS